MAIYEAIVIMDSLIPPKDIETSVERFNSIITEHGGSVRKVDKWGKKRMAYEIEKKQYGYYVSIEFEGVGNIPANLENEFNFNDKVLRYLVYRYDKNKLKAMKLKEENTREAAQAPPPPPPPVAEKQPEKEEEPAPEPVKETTTADSEESETQS